MTELYDADVIVAGLGPAGARAAQAAASAGHSVIALDRKSEAGKPVQCAEFIPTMLGQELDGLEDVTRQRIVAMETFVDDLNPDRTENFPGRMICRQSFDARLVDAAKEAGADCRFGAAIETLTEDGAVQLTSGETVRARIVVGADGPRSRIGRAVGRINTEIVETRQMTVPLLEPHDATDIFLTEDLPGGYAWLFPKGEVANLGAGVIPCAKGVLKELLAELHEELAARGRVGTEVLGYTGGPIPVGGRLYPIAEMGNVPVLLAGDASGLANPVTGAGIASAVISGELAGEAAAGWLSGDRHAFDAYEDELEALFDGALSRALARRKELLGVMGAGSAETDDFRRGWIAYDDYWRNDHKTENFEKQGNAA